MRLANGTPLGPHKALAELVRTGARAEVRPAAKWCFQASTWSSALPRWRWPVSARLRADPWRRSPNFSPTIGLMSRAAAGGRRSGLGGVLAGGSAVLWQSDTFAACRAALSGRMSGNKISTRRSAAPGLRHPTQPTWRRRAPCCRLASWISAIRCTAPDRGRGGGVHPPLRRDRSPAAGHPRNLTMPSDTPDSPDAGGGSSWPLLVNPARPNICRARSAAGRRTSPRTPSANGSS